MRTAPDIYTEYRIPPWLQEHQLRVAAVGVLFARAAGADERPVALTGLFHDMGNILKMDLSGERDVAGAEAGTDVEEWRAVREDFRAKYGDDEHAAALAIGRGIGLPEAVIGMIDNMRFARTEWILKGAPLEMRIAKYADLRVAPYGIVPLDERLAEARERYRGRKFDASSEGYSPEKLAAIGGPNPWSRRWACRSRPS